jgi:hypothetical protein
MGKWHDFFGEPIRKQPLAVRLLSAVRGNKYAMKSRFPEDSTEFPRSDAIWSSYGAPGASRKKAEA